MSSSSRSVDAGDLRRPQLVLLVGVEEEVGRNVEDDIVAIVDEADAAGKAGALEFADPEGGRPGCGSPRW
jgi:hypothetical protein